MIKAAIFDRNNVLIEYDFKYAQHYFEPLLPISIFELGNRWQTWGETVGFPANAAAEKQFWGGFWDQISDEYNLSSEARDKLHAFRYIDVLRPFPDARPTLLALRELGLQIGVLSNFPLATIESSLAAVNLLDCVDVALSSTNIGVAKPNAEAYQHIAQAMHIDYPEAVFIDDTLVHIQAARELGMHAYLLDRQQAEHDLASGLICELTIIPELCQR
ncbi:MAG: HAD-IA family hydrolase [Anaerolineae bacterium]|nr:HAD-IA family hydrolase [Anaerolineae bacterium]